MGEFHAINSTNLVMWKTPVIPQSIKENVLFLPIMHRNVKSIPIKGIDENLIDLTEIVHHRLKPLSFFNAKYKNSYEEYSKIRYGVYKKLVTMLDILPSNIGIAYFEGYRPIEKQKEYFDKKFQETLVKIKDKHLAYEETSKLVSPFIDNIPTHATAAAIDITLFEHENGQESLIDMGKFDVIFGTNDQQETFSENTTSLQRKNRLILLKAATEAGLVNYGHEWWHYSYGDRAWAYVKGQSHAIYGLANEKDKDNPILLIDKATYLGE